ncbi:VOC family protein [Microbispora sp. CA-102843]|uniref:VOC family protein n=1 Tax=Microbispora sp. CA-102843 TaxID=3239952 RepID=UPI003D8B5FF2
MKGAIHAFHHTALLTRDLDGLERAYRSSGFTLSPRSRHLLTERPGEEPVAGCPTNRCALFGGAYIQLLGIVEETAPRSWNTRAIADQCEGFRLPNFDTYDAEAAVRLTGAGLRTSGVLDLQREVDTEDGPAPCAPAPSRRLRGAARRARSGSVLPGRHTVRVEDVTAAREIVETFDPADRRRVPHVRAHAYGATLFFTAR